ncbi:glycosyltransferase family 2 protein [Empedobacter brevis]|uniref:glycosyltransferase family 2 protein n=1 Tax=Empedobacter brevis TaxID=247 RepID=UPI00289D4E2E|nr:glycosyltransferase family 2 protein [Empedobacter brevis]
MTNQPLVSIIIPTYNRADLIGETLDSIIAQTYQNWECIVVDDGSTDNTEEVLNHYIEKETRISYYKRQSNYKPGGNGARNYGFDISKGEYINWFDSDDVMTSDFISVKINSIENDDIIICSHSTVNSELELIKEHDIIIEKNILYDYLVWGDNFNVLTPSILFNKFFLTKNNFRFNEAILRGQETEFLLSIFSKNYQTLNYKIINQALFYYRQHSSTKSAKNSSQPKIFNFSGCFVNFQKLKISKKNNYLRIVTDTKQRLKRLSIKVVQERDFKSMLFIVKELLTFKSFQGIFLGIGIFIFYLFNKTPEFIYNLWSKI